MPAGIAIVSQITNAGTFNSAGTRQLSIDFVCIIVGQDDTSVKQTLQAVLDPTNTVASWGAAIGAAVDAFAASRGYTLAAGFKVLPNFTKV